MYDTIDTITINGIWYEVEQSDCYTYVILRDRWGFEFKVAPESESWNELFGVNTKSA